jgi:hypothetical protein
VVHMVMAAWLMRCLSQGHHTPGLAGEDGKHTSEDLISAGPCLLRRAGGKGIPDLHGLGVQVATRLGVVTGAAFMKGSVHRNTAGRPRSSQAMTSCIVHDPHEPQSPIAATTKSHRSANSSMRGGSVTRE